MKRYTTRAIAKRGGDESTKITVIASTDTSDRAGDIVDQSTWQLDHYRENPVVLWAHQSGGGFDGAPPLPLGRAKVELVEGALVAEIEWDTGHDLGAQVARQFSAGYLNAVSVGFRPGRMVSRSGLDEADPRFSDRGYVLLDNELLEISAVPVPANQEALAVRRGFEVTADLKAAILEGVRDALADDDECQRLVNYITDEIKAAKREDFWGEDVGEDVDDWFDDEPEDDEDEADWFTD